MCGAGGTKYHRAKRQGRAWLRGHFPYNEFTISRCAAGAHRACARGTMLRRTGLTYVRGPRTCTRRIYLPLHSCRRSTPPAQVGDHLTRKANGGAKGGGRGGPTKAVLFHPALQATSSGHFWLERPPKTGADRAPPLPSRDRVPDSPVGCRETDRCTRGGRPAVSKEAGDESRV